MTASWIWMPHPAHFICAFDCRFHMATKVGSVIVSTVGEYFPDAPTREILADCRGINLEGIGDRRKADYMEKIGFEEIGCERKYETMVFRAIHAEGQAPLCCPWRIADGMELEMDGYMEAGHAYVGHYKMCKKWEGLIPVARSQEDEP